MADVIEIGICPLCNLPISEGQSTAIDENGETVHSDCWGKISRPESVI